MAPTSMGSSPPSSRRHGERPPTARTPRRSSVPRDVTLSDERTRMLARLFAPTLEVQAHCDLPCGVYDPSQARLEAESIKAIIGKVADNDDPDFPTPPALIKEERSQLVQHHSRCCGPTTSSRRTSRSTRSSTCW